MENISRNAPKRARDVFYYRQRYKNRVFARLVSFFAEEAERTGLTKKDIAERLNRDPALITRWLANPGNLTLETISDLLLALDAEPEPPEIVRFEDRLTPNYAHPLIARAIGLQVPPRHSAGPVVDVVVVPENGELLGTASGAVPQAKVVAEMELL